MPSRGLVVYFSRIGNNAAIARDIQAATGFDLQEIKEKGGPASFMRCGFDSLRGAQSALVPMDLALTGYDRIVLCGQVWAGKSSPPINAYLAQANFAGKQVWLVVTRSDPKEPQQVIDSMRARGESRGGKVAGAVSFVASVNSISPRSGYIDALHSWLRSQGLMAEGHADTTPS